MKVTYGIGKVKRKIKNAVLVIGVFDGVHRGHQTLIKAAMEKAKAMGGKAIVMTFDPHPVHVLHPKKFLPLISSLPYRLKLLSDLGVDECIVVHFTRAFSKLDPKSFIKKYLIDHIGPEEIFVGDDFHFGRNRQGSLDVFSRFGKHYGFKIDAVHTVEAIKSLREEGLADKIGSTLIRHLIMDGRLNDAEKLLGREISLLGNVVRGDKRGKKLGFATANIDLHNEVIPPLGIYAVKVQLASKVFNGMANLGYCPSFRRKKINLEVHLFDFNQNIYSKEIVVKFIKKIRNEQVFGSNDDLIAQMKDDEQKVKKVLLEA